MRGRLARAALGIALGIALCALAAWQFDWMGASLDSPIVHGENEDWDWQLTLYEATRAELMDWRELPGWTPWTQGGVPLWANPEFPALYPLFWLIPALGTGPGIKVWVLLHLWLLVLGGYVAGREIGLSPVGAHGAALLTLCSAFTPEFIAYGHIMYLPLGWLPLAWVALRRGRWHWAGAALAMTFLAGGHYLLLYGALWLGLDGLLRGLDADRVRWLVPPLLLNAALLGVGWAAWPVGLALAAAVAWQRPVSLRRDLPPVLLAGLLAGLLLAPKLTTAPVLFARAERLAAQVSLSIADDYTPAMAWGVLTGAAGRLSGHEGQNVFWHGAPVALGILGLAWSGLRWRLFGVLGLTWWCLGWGGATPVNFLEVLHRLPGFDHLRVVERYSLVWTLFLGWGVGYAVDEAWRRRKPAGVVLGALVAWYVVVAAPRAAGLQRLGAGRTSQVAAGDFVQVEDDLTNFEAARANRGKLDCWTTAWLEDPSPALRAVGHPEYRGEAWLLETGATLEARITPNSVTVDLGDGAGTVVINQNAFEGWTADGAPASSHQGLIAAALGPGVHTLRYQPPGLAAGLALMALGGVVMLGAAVRELTAAGGTGGSEPWTAPAPGASSSAPPPGTGGSPR